MTFTSKWGRLALLTGSLLASRLGASAAPLVEISSPTDPLAPVAECLLQGPESLPKPGSTGFISLNNPSAPLIAVHPKNHRLMFAVMNQDVIQSTSSDVIGPIGLPADLTIAYSQNGGKRWHKTVAPFNFCLGTNLSDSIALEAVAYSPAGGKDGTAFICGNFTDFRNGIHNSPESGVFISRSKDGGKNWEPAVTVATGISDPDFGVTGAAVTGGFVAVDPVHHDKVYANWSSTVFPSTFFGDIFFAKSDDLGEHFSDPKLIYSIADDPSITNEFTSQGGGQSLIPALAVIKKQHGKRVLVSGFLRFYPFSDTTCYSQNFQGRNAGLDPDGDPCTPVCPNSVVDHAIVRSFDGGETWEKTAISISPSVLAEHFDPTVPPTSPTLLVADGALGISFAVDDRRDILYAVWQAGHSDDSQCIPGARPQIWLSLSKDDGSTWSEAVVVSRTTANGATDVADQAFCPNVAVNDDGTVAVGYYDFRNFNPDSEFPVASTDAWVAFYKPVNHIGSTGIGLDFCDEQRLTPSSFDSHPSFEYPLFQFFSDNEIDPPLPIPSSGVVTVGSQMGLTAQKDDFYTAFTIINTGFDPFLVSQPEYLGLENTSTDQNAMIDYNNYANCFTRKVDADCSETENSSSQSSSSSSSSSSR